MNTAVPHSNPATRQDLFDRLEALGIATRTVAHERLFTVEQSRQVELELDGGHTKNLFLKDAKDRLFLVVALHIDGGQSQGAAQSHRLGAAVVWQRRAADEVPGRDAGVGDRLCGQ